MSNNRMATDADDMAMVADLIARIRDRLEPLDDVKRVASRDDVRALREDFAVLQRELSKSHLDQVIAASRNAAHATAEQVGKKASLLERSAEEIRLDQHNFLDNMRETVEPAERLVGFVSRWRWLLGLAVLLLACGIVAPLIYFGLVQSEAASFGQAMKNPLAFESACSDAEGYRGQTSLDQEFCGFLKPEQ